jgi:thiamine-phosphate pyrophosphorylase
MKSRSGAAGAWRGLYAITPDWSDSRRLLAVTEAILAAGCRFLQYRNKATTDCHRQEQAVALRGLTRKYGARLIINDDVDLALFCDADGVHLGEDDGALAAARIRLDAAGPGKILGASCYQSLGKAVSAARMGADYIAFGSFFASPTKPLAKRADLGLLAAGKEETGLPVCAIGGITPDNAGELVRAGADLLAVISALYEADAPGRATRQFVNFFEENP